MDDENAIVELASYREISAEEIERYEDLLSLQDLGVDDEIVRRRVFKYNVFRGAQYGTVPVLRQLTCYDRGRGVGLSQVLARCLRTPIMGETAMISPLNDQLWQNEQQIALEAFRVVAEERLSDE